MTLEQAIEILDPKNPYYEDSYTVHRARYMGMEALKIRMPKKVKIYHCVKWFYVQVVDIVIYTRNLKN
jgi:hypothetical protein